ncbi:MAG TPA: enoyl-CoA hydratase-related protein [Candidatus Baltobacteraceae bacterium]|nr:enoyl-CoA hydratase-related protein [Candidatus Baltobacteraceae bacterium]
MSEHLIYSKDGAVASIRFNRPEKKNALTTAMYAAMADALSDAASDDAIRAVGLYGGDVFTAGNDIGDFLAAGALHGDLPVVKVLKAMIAFPKPILAAVKGNAIGIGTTLLMHCDAVVAGKSAKFALPFTKLGLVPEAASSVLFPLIAGRARATWYLLSGEGFGPDAARDMGLVTRVVDDAEVDASVATMCATLAELPPNAMATSKRLIKAPFAGVVETALNEELAAFAAALVSDEARSAFMKFMSRA